MNNDPKARVVEIIENSLVEWCGKQDCIIGGIDILSPFLADRLDEAGLLVYNPADLRTKIKATVPRLADHEVEALVAALTKKFTQHHADHGPGVWTED